MKFVRSRFVSRLFCVVAILSLLTACSAPTATTPTAPTAANPDQKNLKNVRVLLSFLMQSLDAPLIVAVNQGYFAQEGLNVTFERGFGNVDTISKLGTGKFDIGFSDLYNTLEFNDKNPNDQLKAVAIIQNRSPFSVVTFKEKGINQPKALEGKKLGAPAGDGPRKLFPLFAASVGFKADSVTWETMEPKLRETFLLQGKVDAVSGFSTSVLPALLKAGKKMEDLNVFYYGENGLDFYGNAILVKQSYLEQNPDVLKAFVKGYLRGLQDVLREPTAGLEAAIAADQSKLMDREMEKTRLQIALERMLITPEVESLGLGTVEPKRLEKTIAQTVEGFGLKSTPKASDIFTDQFLPPKEQRTVPPASERKPLN
jgi:NitT/TauT family transport system substrate-binding protein